eukprot:gene10858-10965_t
MAAAAYNAMGETVVRLYGSNDQLQFGQFQWFVADVTGKTVAAEVAGLAQKLAAKVPTVGGEKSFLTGADIGRLVGVWGKVVTSDPTLSVSTWTHPDPLAQDWLPALSKLVASRK